MKLTVYIENVNYDHKEVNDPKEIALLVKNHISHLGKVSIYYKVPTHMLTWWQRLLRYCGSGY